MKPIAFTTFACITALLPALAGCGGGGPPPAPEADIELAQAENAARTAYDRGQLPLAVTLYQRALNRARAMDNPEEITTAAYNLAAVLTRTGEYGRAATLLEEAESEAWRARVPGADVLLLRAKVARLAGDPATAVAYAERVLSQRSARPTPAHAAQAHVLQGQVAVEAQDLATAQSELAQARTAAGAGAPPAVRASIEGLDADLLRTAGNMTGAAAAYDAQADLLREAKLYDDLPDVLAMSGDAWRAASRPRPTADRFYRAARAAAAQGRTTDAWRWLGWAQVTAPYAADPNLTARIDALREQMPLVRTVE